MLCTAFLCLSDRLMLLLYNVTLSLCLLLKLNDDDDDDWAKGPDRLPSPRFRNSRSAHGGWLYSLACERYSYHPWLLARWHSLCADDHALSFSESILPSI